MKESERGLYQAVQNGEITGMSFGFRAVKDKWETVGNFKQRTIEEMTLIEVSILDTIPAYNNTSAEVRSINIPMDFDIMRKRLELYKIMIIEVVRGLIMHIVITFIFSFIVGLNSDKISNRK